MTFVSRWFYRAIPGMFLTLLIATAVPAITQTLPSTDQNQSPDLSQQQNQTMDADAAAADAATAANLSTKLVGGRFNGILPTGHADFRVRNGSRHLVVEVEDIGLRPGTKVNVFINHKFTGRITIGNPPARRGELDLNQRDGETVPAVQAGFTVKVVTTAGRAIVAGVFSR